MKSRDYRRFVLFGLALAGLLMFAPAFACAADAAAGADPQREVMTRQFEALAGQLAGPGHEEPVFTDLGNGFYSVFIALPPGARERFQEALGAEETNEKAQTSLTVISVGQAVATPSTPVTTSHGALSDTTYPYTYWIITLNLGQTVTKATTAKLTGPGLKFNKSIPVLYGGNGIWGIGYRPGSGVGTPGIYTFQGSVSGGGSITTKSFAINP